VFGSRRRIGPSTGILTVLALCQWTVKYKIDPGTDTTTEPRIRRGNVLAAVLAGSWRHCDAISSVTDRELSEIAPLLLKSGGAALGWWKIRNSDSRDSPAARQLHQAYRHHALRAAVQEREIKQIIAFLRFAGLEPLLGKGWAIARLYPKHGLRPYGDIDLYVRAEEYRAVDEALMSPDAPGGSVDLHKGAQELDDRSVDDLYDRSQLVSLGEVPVRILGPEDHLRLLCLHALRHGAWRPLWLCDIALAIESRNDNFDWDYFLSGDKRRSDWVACAIGLARQLLGVRVDDTPVAERAESLPHWFIPTVLRQWGQGQTPHGCRAAMENYLRHPAGILEALRVRWPNAIEATIGVRGPFNELPRLPFQIGDAILRTAKFLAQAPSSQRQ